MNKTKNGFFITHICLIISVVIALLTLFTGCGDTIEGTKISLEDATGLAGDTINLPFSISENSGIWGGQILINYDSSAIEFESCTNGVVFDMCDYNDNKGQLSLVVMQLEEKDTKDNGLIATLNFKIKDVADDGEYEISFDAATNFSNIQGELQDVSFEGCTVTVK